MTHKKDNLISIVNCLWYKNPVIKLGHRLYESCHNKCDGSIKNEHECSNYYPQMKIVERHTVRYVPREPYLEDYINFLIDEKKSPEYTTKALETFKLFMGNKIDRPELFKTLNLNSIEYIRYKNLREKK